MSTQSYAPDRQATSQQASGQQITSQPTTSQKGTGPSWFQIWAAVIGTAVLAGLVVLAVGLWHGQSSATPATTGTPTSTSAPAQPSANPAVPTGPSANPAVPSHPTGQPRRARRASRGSGPRHLRPLDDAHPLTGSRHTSGAGHTAAGWRHCSTKRRSSCRPRRPHLA